MTTGTPPGAAPERTGLAWERTAFATAVLTAVTLRLIASRHLALAVALSGCAILVVGGLVAAEISRYRRSRTTQPRWARDGRVFAALAVHLAVSGAAALTLIGVCLYDVR